MSLRCDGSNELPRAGAWIDHRERKLNAGVASGNPAKRASTEKMQKNRVKNARKKCGRAQESG
jgi:hypothetical protein